MIRFWLYKKLISVTYCIFRTQSSARDYEIITVHTVVLNAACCVFITCSHPFYDVSLAKFGRSSINRIRGIYTADVPLLGGYIYF